MIQRFPQLLSSILLMLLASACTVSAGDNESDGSRPGRASDEFEPGRVIPAEHYEISDFRCVTQPGKVNVEGETVDEDHWIAKGTLTNLLETGSPHYELTPVLNLEDGTKYDSGGESFFSVGPKVSGEFSIFVAGSLALSAPVVDCELVVYDSALNYVD